MLKERPQTNMLPTISARHPLIYAAELATTIIKEGKPSHHRIGLKFSLELLQKSDNGTMHIAVKTLKRVLLSEKKTPIIKHNKAQRIALKAASLNDHLIFEVSENFQIIRLINTQTLQKKWNELRVELLTEYADLKDIVSHYDWQLQNDHIQQVFLEDNFYNFLFPNCFNRKFREKEAFSDPKLISNGLGTLSIPVIVSTHIHKHDTGFTRISLATNGLLDTENNAFPLSKLNAFIGGLGIPAGEDHPLHFAYSGTYEVDGIKKHLSEGALRFSFEVKEHYFKETTFSFQLKAIESNS